MLLDLELFDSYNNATMLFWAKRLTFSSGDISSKNFKRKAWVFTVCTRKVNSKFYDLQLARRS